MRRQCCDPNGGLPRTTPTPLVGVSSRRNPLAAWVVFAIMLLSLTVYLNTTFTLKARGEGGYAETDAGAQRLSMPKGQQQQGLTGAVLEDFIKGAGAGGGEGGGGGGGGGGQSEEQQLVIQQQQEDLQALRAAQSKTVTKLNEALATLHKRLDTHVMWAGKADAVEGGAGGGGGVTQEHQQHKSAGNPATVADVAGGDEPATVQQQPRKSPSTGTEQQQAQLLQGQERGQGWGKAVEGLPFVVLGIPTVPRPQNAEYLRRTLEAIVSQMPEDPTHPLFGEVMVVVMNMEHGTRHQVFEEAKEFYGPGHPHAPFIFFLEEKDGDAVDGAAIADKPRPPAVAVSAKGAKVRKPVNPPSPQAVKQTRNLVALLRAAASKAEHYLFMEDDMELCEKGLETVMYMIAKTQAYHPDWIAMRASYGMNGIVLKAEDVLPFADYMLKHIKRRPPDHLVVEWFAGETQETHRYKSNRPNTAFRYNIFHHMGKLSTLRGSKSPSYPLCYEELGPPVLFPVESFDPKHCPNDDVWPCLGRGAAPPEPPADYKALNGMYKKTRPSRH